VKHWSPIDSRWNRFLGAYEAADKKLENSVKVLLAPLEEGEMSDVSASSDIVESGREQDLPSSARSPYSVSLHLKAFCIKCEC